MYKKKMYSYGFIVPAGIIFTVFFLIPIVISFYYSLTVWNFDSATFCGLDNYKMLLTEDGLRKGLINTLLYAFLTSGLKVLIAFGAAIFFTSAIKSKNLLRSIVFFPNLVSGIAVGATFKAMMHPTKGILNQFLAFLGIHGPNWLGDPDLALFSVIGVDIWKGISISLIIFIAGIESVDHSYYEAAMIDGATYWQRLWYITVPMTTSSRNTIIILSLIGGIRSFDLIWSMTGGGPGFATDVIASVIYKQYSAGYYGLSTAGSVVLLILILVLVTPLQKLLDRQEAKMS